MGQPSYLLVIRPPFMVTFVDPQLATVQSEGGLCVTCPQLCPLFPNPWALHSALCKINVQSDATWKTMPDCSVGHRHGDFKYT